MKNIFRSLLRILKDERGYQAVNSITGGATKAHTHASASAVDGGLINAPTATISALTASTLVAASVTLSGLFTAVNSTQAGAAFVAGDATYGSSVTVRGNGFSVNNPDLVEVSGSLTMNQNIASTLGTIRANVKPGNNFILGGAGVNCAGVAEIASDLWGLTFQPGCASSIGTNVLTWNSAGRVGIGTTAPGSKLHVSSDTLILDGNGAAPTAGFALCKMAGGQVGHCTNGNVVTGACTCASP